MRKVLNSLIATACHYCFYTISYMPCVDDLMSKDTKIERKKMPTKKILPTPYTIFTVLEMTCVTTDKQTKIIITKHQTNKITVLTLNLHFLFTLNKTASGQILPIKRSLLWLYLYNPNINRINKVAL